MFEDNDKCRKFPNGCFLVGPTGPTGPTGPSGGPTGATVPITLSTHI